MSADINRIVDYYEDQGAFELADEFRAELNLFIQQALERPNSFSVRERGLRRVNLRRFPYRFLFRIAGETIRIMVVRHHSRDPELGAER